MAEYTENYNLTKQGDNEYVEIDVMNDNMDKIDQAIAEAGNNPQLEIDVAEIKDKIGSTDDTGGSSTVGSVFAKLNYLVSQVSSYLSNIYSRIGSQSDTASSATSASAHGKLNWFLNLFGKTDDTGGTKAAGTVMGKLNNIINGTGRLVDIKESNYAAVMSLGVITPVLDIERQIPSDINNMTRLGVDNDFLYVHDSLYKKVFIFNRMTLEKLGETLAQAGRTDSPIVSDDGYFYYSDVTLKKIIKFDKNTFAKVGETSAQSYMSQDLVMDEGYIYYPLYLSDKIVKFDKNTLAKVGETSAQSAIPIWVYVDETHLYVINRSGETGSFAYKLAKIDKTTLTKVSETTSLSDSPLDIKGDSGFIYVLQKSNTDYVDVKIVRFRKSNLTKVDEVTLPSENIRKIFVNDEFICYQTFGEENIVLLNKDFTLKSEAYVEGMWTYYIAIDNTIYSTKYVTENGISDIGFGKYDATKLYKIAGFKKE